MEWSESIEGKLAEYIKSGWVGWVGWWRVEGLEE